jgi:HK97 family phage prohead protease
MPATAGGEQRELPDAYRPAISDDVPEGRACGNCRFYDETQVNPDGVRVWCSLWADWVRGDHYCDRWEPAEARAKRQVQLDLPAYISTAARKGLDYHADGFGGDGLADSTIAEARAMADGDITEAKVIKANAWAARHRVDLDAPSNSDNDHDDFPGPGAVAHYLWGIDPLDPDPATSWFARKAEKIKAERQRPTMQHAERRDNQTRFVEFRANKSEDGLTLDGYAAVFDEWTDIEDHLGTYRERITPGAFKRTLGMRMPVLQFDHGSHPLIGSLPLGRITSIAEDAHGLRVKARLSDNWLVEPVRDAIRDGGISGMSFRFRVVDEDWQLSRSDGAEERTIREVELYEVGPVVFPAYAQTSVGVRSRQTLTALQDPEVRAEIARILATGTDVTSLADPEAPLDEHAPDSDAPVLPDHAAVRTRIQRQARVRLAGL